MGKRRQKIKEASDWLNLSIVGFQFPIAIGLGYLWGWWMDGLFGTKPVLTIIFSLFGMAAGFLNLFRMTLAATRKEERARKLAEESPSQPGNEDGGNGGDQG